MILVPKHCSEFCSMTEKPYMFKCKHCGKDIPAEIIISGRTWEEEMELYLRYQTEESIKNKEILYG